MLEGILDDAAIERAAEAIYSFDEDLTDKGLRETDIPEASPRLLWAEFCEAEPDAAASYRGRARAALLAALRSSPTLN